MKVTMDYELLNLGKGFSCPKHTVTAIWEYVSSPAKKRLMEMKSDPDYIVIDATGGKTTKTLVLTDSKTVYRSAVSKSTIDKRYAGKETIEPED